MTPATPRPEPSRDGEKGPGAESDAGRVSFRGSDVLSVGNIGSLDLHWTITIDLILGHGFAVETGGGR